MPEALAISLARNREKQTLAPAQAAADRPALSAARGLAALAKLAATIEEVHIAAGLQHFPCPTAAQLCAWTRSCVNTTLLTWDVV